MSGTPSIMLSAFAGATFVKQFTLYTTNATGAQLGFGGPGWGAEMSIVDYTTNPGTPTKVATATIENNKIAWLAPGLIWVAFPQAETALWNWRRAGWHLDLIAPSSVYDVAGLREVFLRGFITCEQRAPNTTFVAPTQNSL